MKKYIRMKKGMFLLVLSGCLLLAGCRKETGSENRRVDACDNIQIAVPDGIGDSEAVDIELEDASNKHMTVISVLGKEELTIESERIYKDKRGSGYLDNRFTLEELDIILKPIEGTWIADEYVGFVPYENSIWSEQEGEEEINRKKYEDAVEQAEGNLPEFYFQVKGYNDKEPVDGKHYIYVYTDNKAYTSPMSVTLCMKEKGEENLGYINRTSQGDEISEQFSYPVVYIDFFSISCSTEGTVIYEPVTLVMASDRTFLLLKDGAFYSLKNCIQGRIMSGDFSCLEGEDWESEQKSYERQRDVYEWRQLDLNGDGIEDLILQEKNTVHEESNQHRILGIFGCGEDKARCVLWDDVYMGNFSFCGQTGELMEYYYSFGTMVDLEGYRHYYYDMEWNEITDYNLLIWYVDGPEGYTYPTEWFEAHPDMQEKGTYYRKYTGEDVEGEALTLEGLKEIFRTEMGMEIEYSR